MATFDAISNHYYSRVIAVTQASLIALALILATTMVVSITKNKLNNLREGLALQDAFEISTTSKLKQLDCLTKNIYWEAASEPFEGKVAVAQVTMNRVASGNFGNGVCGVVHQKNVFYQKVVCQFSWVCETTHKIKPVHPAMYAESQEVAKKVLFENFRLPGLKNALYYHATYVNPGWRKQKIAQIGQHIFYKD